MVTNQDDDTPPPATTTVPPRSLAERLFGADPPAPPEPATPALEPWSPNADEVALYGVDYPAPPETFSPETSLRPILREREPELMTVLGLGQADRIARHRDFVATMRESGLDAASVGQQLYSLKTDAEVAVKHGREFDDSKAVAMFEDMNSQLLARYGPQRGEAIVRAFDAFVGEHPKLRSVLETPGIAHQFGFKRVLEAITDHVRVEGNL